mmetsp:Transcript_17914/g.46800  ORF Transcript_17914/g.46800 Transcript_17914/m.46800 type:complete len:583 (+) Transcript_17914:161-1909(+)
MDFSDILRYRPSTDLNDLGRSSTVNDGAAPAGPTAPIGGAAGKRKREDPFAVPAAKAARPPDADPVEDERARALRMMEADTAPVDGPGLDDAAVRRLVHGLSRKVSKNSQMRMKHSDDPTKFLTSEADLHDQIKEMHSVAAVPEHYGEVIRLGGLKTVINLLNHENEDIVAATIELLQEMTDADTLDGEEEHAAALIDGLLETDLLPTLMDAFSRLKDGPDGGNDGLQAALGIFENMLDLKPELAERLVKECDILPWLISRVKAKRFDPIKLYASEILAILLQSTDANRSALVADGLSGIDRLLQSVAQYKRKDPSSGEEFEMLQNLFGALCSAVMLKSNIKVFLEAEGVELMVILLRERRMSMHGALKVLDHALSQGELSESACATFVECGGLRSLFPALMKTPPAGKGWRRVADAEFEEHTVSIISSLLRTLRNEAHSARVLKKFVEADFAKLERLVELHLKYLGRLRACEAGLDDERKAMEAEGAEFDDVAENDHYLKRLDAGLHTLQHVDLILGEVLFKCGAAACSRAAALIRMKSSSFAAVAEVLDEYADNIDDSNPPGAAAKSDVQALLMVVRAQR